MAHLRVVFSLIFTLGVLTARTDCGDLDDKEWWETSLVYQIWPRGFQDSDGDGQGDLKGIINRLDYLKDLGIDTIWLNPIYSSPLVDAGYDISNYTDVNPIFGSLEHLDELIEEAHNRELKVILDIVPNHSSDQHEWFSLSARNVEPYKNYYVWADGNVDKKGNKIPPNNWASTYSDDEGSAWTWHNGRKQWYYHKFHTSQPDLNLRNENVLNELLDIFSFWLQREVDGFRINAVSYFFEDENLRNEPSGRNKSYTSGLPENTALLYKFRAFIDDWVARNRAQSKLLIAESHNSDNILISYYGNETHDGIPPFNFRFINDVRNNSDADYIKRILDGWFEKLPDNASTNWVLSNHDNSRAATRIGLNRVDGLHMLSLLLPGQAYTYYGEEIAMLDTKILWNETIDPMGCSRSKETYEEYSRDPSRTPMQWNSKTSAGFSTNDTTYLPVHPNYVDRNVEEQENQKRSNLNTYKLLSALRKDVVFTHGEYAFGTLNNGRVLVLKRFFENYPIYLIVVNLGLRQEKVNLTSLYPDLEGPLEIIVASSNAVYVNDTVSKDNFILTANAALVLKAGILETTTESSTITTTEIECNTTETITTTTETTTPEDDNATSTEETTTIVYPTTTEKNSAVISSSSMSSLILSAIVTVIMLFRS